LSDLIIAVGRVCVQVEHVVFHVMSDEAGVRFDCLHAPTSLLYVRFARI